MTSPDPAQRGGKSTYDSLKPALFKLKLEAMFFNYSKTRIQYPVSLTTKTHKA